ncbi:mechanosensitive ion channel, partial [bacterium AH-315-B15]|nr:mechanosensitive ion channel [bacterium AH-315-B15]
VFADKPFQQGERIKVDGIDGTVEEIGIRSTRLRTLEGRLVTIPNATFSGGTVENVDREPSRKVPLALGLTYDTSPDQMKQAMQILEDISTDHNDKIEDEPSIGFNAFGDFSLGLLYIYFIRKGQDNLGVQTTINMEILTRFNEAGLDMAFPTQTIINQQG